MPRPHRLANRGFSAGDFKCVSAQSLLNHSIQMACWSRAGLLRNHEPKYQIDHEADRERRYRQQHGNYSYQCHIPAVLVGKSPADPGHLPPGKRPHQRCGWPPSGPGRVAARGRRRLGHGFPASGAKACVAGKRSTTTGTIQSHTTPPESHCNERLIDSGQRVWSISRGRYVPREGNMLSTDIHLQRKHFNAP